MNNDGEGGFTFSTDEEQPPETVEGQTPAAAPVAPAGGMFDFSAAIAGAAMGDAPARATGARKPKAPLMPGAKPELEDLFTADGIGKIASKSLDAFYRSCGAAPLEVAEHNTVAKIVAHYCQVRLPADAGAYQPEALLLFAILSTLPPRVEPVAEKTAPWFARGYEWAVGLFKRKAAPTDG